MQSIYVESNQYLSVYDKQSNQDLGNNINLGDTNHLIRCKGKQNKLKDNHYLKQNLLYTKEQMRRVSMSSDRRFILMTRGNKIYIVKNKRSKIIKSLKFQWTIMEAIFSKDNNHIYTTQPIHLIKISLLNGFQIINQIQIKENSQHCEYQAFHIKELTQNKIIFCHSYKICIYDFANNIETILLQLDKYIFAYDYLFQKNILACSQKQTISLYIQNELFIKQTIDVDLSKIYWSNDDNQEWVQVYFLEFIGDENLISLIKTNLVIWSIDYNQKKLREVQNINQDYFRLDINSWSRQKLFIVVYKNIIKFYQLSDGNKKLKQNQNRVVQLTKLKSYYESQPKLICDIFEQYK